MPNLSPEMSALKSSGSTLQINELRCPSNTDNTLIYCFPLLLIFELAFSSCQHSWFCQLRRVRELRPLAIPAPAGLQSPQSPTHEELSLVPWLMHCGQTLCLKPNHRGCRFIPREVTDLPSPAFQCMSLFKNKIGINPNSEF